MSDSIIAHCLVAGFAGTHAEKIASLHEHLLCEAVRAGHGDIIDYLLSIEQKTRWVASPVHAAFHCTNLQADTSAVDVKQVQCGMP